MITIACVVSSGREKLSVHRVVLKKQILKDFLKSDKVFDVPCVKNTHPVITNQIDKK